MPITYQELIEQKFIRNKNVKVITTSTNYDIKISDCIIIVNGNTAANLNLPIASTCKGSMWFIYVNSGLTWNINAHGSEVINGAGISISMSELNSGCILVSDGVGFWTTVIGGFI